MTSPFDDRDADAVRARLAAIVESSDDAIVSKDLNGIVNSWNSGAERMFGYARTEMIGRSITTIIPPDRLQEEDLVLSRIRRGEPIEHYETIRRRRDGSLLHVSLSVSPIRDSLGQVIGASKIARDISDRKRIETALREADRRKDEFLATLAHELRNPLAPLRSGLDVLLAAPDAPGVRDLLAVMDRQLDHLTRLVGDLLEVSRIARGTIPLQKELLDLRTVIDAAVEMSRPVIEAGSHGVELICPRDEFTVLADRTRLTQIVSNLLNNAARYTPTPGVLRVTATHEGESVALRVSDPGIGIAPDKLESVFQMFVRSHGSALDQEGLGVGLALARKLAEQHGGTLTAHSDGLGKGSEFTLRLALQVPPAIASAPAPGHHPGSARRVMVVDDNVDAANSVAMLLRALSHEVVVAHNGREALTRAATFHPDIVFLDIGMPGMSGLEVASLMRAEPWGKDIYIVALTGWGQRDDRDKTAAVGFDRHLVKPVPYAELVALLGSPEPPAQRVH